MSKAERIEDLGRIRELLREVLDDHASLFDRCTSKHTVDAFVISCKDYEKVCDVHQAIRDIGDRLNTIHYIAIGENFD